MALFFSFNSYAQLKTKVFLTAGEYPYPGGVNEIKESSCVKKDLTPKMGKVRSQTGGTCHAYAAMELLNFGEKREYSALHLATIADQVLAPKSKEDAKIDIIGSITGFSGNTMANDLRAGITKGVCPEDYVPSVVKIEEELKLVAKSYDDYRNVYDDLLCENNLSSDELADKAFTFNMTKQVLEFVGKFQESLKKWEDLIAQSQFDFYQK